jgi:uncharacterized lipoprotein YddW (UPF0748 family)
LYLEKIKDKKRQLQLGMVLIAAVLFFVLHVETANAIKADDSTQTDNCKKFCWISYLDFQTYLMDKSVSEFTDTVSEMYDKLSSFGIDTVIVQVRPMGDAIYPSEYFPVSAYISEDRILPDYDPLEIMIEEAHRKNLSFEAWINPYRLSRSNETTQSYKELAAYDTYMDFIYSYINPDGEECLSLEPSDQRSIDLIVSGVREVIENYDVDGIHFDDYFYVEGMHDGTGDISDELQPEEKMNYVNSMISQVYEAVKECDPGCVFGVSPSGNIDVARQQGADIDRWLSTPGYVDYIMPQIYWTDYYETMDGTVPMFSNMAKLWQSVNVLDLPIYTGLALYRAGEASDTDTGWSTYSDNLAKSWQTAELLGYDGYALFRYEWFDMEIAAAELKKLSEVSCANDTEKIHSVIEEITRLAYSYITP